MTARELVLGWMDSNGITAGCALNDQILPIEVDDLVKRLEAWPFDALIESTRLKLEAAKIEAAKIPEMTMDLLSLERTRRLLLEAEVRAATI